MNLLALAPGLFAPLQSLLAFLPQIAIALFAILTALVRPQVYRWLWAKAKSNKPVAAGVTLLAAGAITGAIAWSRRTTQLPPPTQEAMRDGWWTFRKDAGRSGGDGGAGPNTIAPLWTYIETLDKESFASSPAVWAGRVYVGSDGEVLYCFDAEKLETPQWTYAMNHEVFASPTIANGKVFIGEGLHHHTDARLVCLDAVTGEKIWQFQTTSHVEDAPTVADGRVWFGAGDDGVYCLDEKTGTKIWQAKGMHIDTSPLLVEGLVIVGAGYGETGIAAYKADTGERAWFTKMPAQCWGPPSLGPAGIIVGIGNGDFVNKHPDPRAEVLCLSIRGGGIVWRTKLEDAVLAAAAISGNRAFLGDRSGAFSCFDATTGKQIWQVSCGRGVVSSAAIAPNVIVYACLGGHVHGVHPDSGNEIWKFDASKGHFQTINSFASSPAISGGKVYIGCDNFRFYCLGEKK